MDYDIDFGAFALLPKEVLGRAMHANLEQVGGVEYDEAELEFAETIRASLGENRWGNWYWEQGHAGWKQRRLR